MKNSKRNIAFKKVKSI